MREFGKENCEVKEKLKIFNNEKYKKEGNNLLTVYSGKKYESKVDSIVQNRKRGSMGTLSIVRNRNHL